MFLTKIVASPGGFHSPPPTSRPPTKVYDRQSFVLVVADQDDILKFMKMHLNRFFSHVVVKRTSAEAMGSLKEHDFDLVICDGSASNKQMQKLIHELSIRYRKLPYVMLDLEQSCTVDDFPGLLVIDIIPPPYDLDTMHCAIRRALNIGHDLRELEPLVLPKYAIGQLIRKASLPDNGNKTADLVRKIRERLSEEIDP